MKEYKWKETWGAKITIPVETAVTAFETVETTYGKLTAKNLLEFSKNPKSPLHTMFEWDDSIAANRYRIEQARKIINSIEITIVSDGEALEIGAYEIVRTDSGNAYKNITAFTQSDVDYVREQTITTINTLSCKLKTYKQFRKIGFDLDKIKDELTSV